MRRIALALAAGGLAVGIVLAGAGQAQATLEMQKKAKEAGFTVGGCQYCHVEKLPKKGAVTQNERGKWLISEKQAKKAKEIDVSWLKEYVEKK